MNEQSKLLGRITARPEVLGGKPIIRDMRISVELVLSLLAQGVTPEAILDDYPDLEPDDVTVAAELNCDDAAPKLGGGAFRASIRG